VHISEYWAGKMIDPMIVKGYKLQFSRRKLEWLEEEEYQLVLIPA